MGRPAGPLFVQTTTHTLLVHPREHPYRQPLSRLVLQGNLAFAGQGGAVVVVEAAEKSGALITVEHALDLAVSIAKKNPIGAMLVKESVKAAYETTLAAGLEVERQAIRLAFARGAHVEGMRRFLSKRRN